MIELNKPTRRSLYGVTLFVALLLSVLVGTGVPLSPLWPGVLFWLVGLALFGSLRSIQRAQALVMAGLGFGAALLGITNGESSDALLRALYVNHVLLAMLGAVTFLRLITPVATTSRTLPRGRAALWRTLLGVHLFGAVINMSVLVIVGDRLARRGRLHSLQARLLSRGFSLAAHWSPFFVAMGVALTMAPGSQLLSLSLLGLLPAALGLWIAGHDLSRQPGAERLRGYPIDFGALWMPLLLALGVILLRQLLPEVGVITLVTVLSLVFVATLLGWRQRREAGLILGRQITQELPRMGGEVVLFLSAGVLSVGIGILVRGLGWHIDATQFGALEAVLLLWVMVGLAVLGVHPLISISTTSGLLGPVVLPDLLGLTFLMTWALGVAASPLSGMHMTLQGRYEVPAYRFVGWNGRYVLLMLVVDSLFLLLYEQLLRQWLPVGH